MYTFITLLVVAVILLLVIINTVVTLVQENPNRRGSIIGLSSLALIVVTAFGLVFPGITRQWEIALPVYVIVLAFICVPCIFSSAVAKSGPVDTSVWKRVMSITMVLIFSGLIFTVYEVAKEIPPEGQIIVEDTCYTVVDSVEKYKNDRNIYMEDCDGRVWVSDEAVQGIAELSLGSEEGFYRMSGTSGGVSHDGGYLLEPGIDAVYVEVKKEDSLRSVPLVLKGDGTFVYFYGPGSEVIFD